MSLPITIPTTQKHRSIAITTSLGDNALIIKSMSGTETLSGCFKFELELMSQQQEKINFDDIVGENVTIELNLDDDKSWPLAGKTRFFNGLVSSFEQIASLDKGFQYRAVVVPWLWLLTRTHNCRIFQNKTVPEIIQQVFENPRYSGFTNFKFSLDTEKDTKREYEPREYCVQYRESDFNFVSRLMEEEGIYYFFEHTDKGHKLILTDSISKHSPYSGYEQIEYHPNISDEHSQCVRELSVGQEVQPGIFALKCFDFVDPKNDLHVKSTFQCLRAATDLEHYDYHPRAYQKNKAGESYAKIRGQEMHTNSEVVRGKTDARGLSTGYTFQLTDSRPESLNREYLVTSCSYKIRSNVQKNSDNEQIFTADFTAMSTAQQFRPPRVTPKPAIQGPQTAIVVTEDGEDITVDEYGRVKVKFHWDREKNSDENSSCWIRVAQVWAGKKWGAMYIPRKDQEVIVEFLDGDPDQPIITGRVYNAKNKPPIDLPVNKTRSTIKSNSTKGGGGSNEIRFEDKKDDEEIYIHAEKKLRTVVEGSESRSVGGSRSTTVSGGSDILGVPSGNIEMRAGKWLQGYGENIILAATNESVILNCGDSFITITPTEITIESLVINIKGGLTKINCT